MTTIEFYKFNWDELNTLGRLTLFPLTLLVFPLVWFVTLCEKGKA